MPEKHIFVTPFPLDMSPYPIYDYFNSNYGDVSNVSLHSQETYISAIVLFEHAESACDASLAVQHVITGNRVHVISSIPNRIRSPPGFMDLNDDCLRAILKRLDLEDLSIVAKTCGRLKGMVHVVVSSQKNKVNLVVQSAAHLERCIKDIGPWVCSLSLKGSPQLAHNRVLKVLMQYCRQTLSNLKMKGFFFDHTDRAIIKSRVLFSCVQKLVLVNCSIPVEWLTKCPELAEAEFIDTEIIFDGFEDLACPKLSTLKIFADYSHQRDSRGLQRFLQQNVQIRALHIDIRGDEYYDQDDIGDVKILNSASPSIKSLAISYSESSELGHFHELMELRLIQLRSPFDLRPVLDRNAASLEHFEFDERNWSQKLDWRNVSAISRLRKLKKLTVCVHKCERHHFQQMIKYLNELEDLRIGSHENPFDEDNMHYIIRNKPNLQRLSLSFRCNGVNSEDRLKINSEMYRKMLDLILLRTNGKPLQVVIIGPENEISQIDASFDMHPSLQITCFSMEFVVSVLNIDADENDGGDWYITITDEDLKLLRSR